MEGRIATGKISPGMSITFSPGGVEDVIKRVEMHAETLAEGIAGDYVCLELQNSNVDQIQTGISTNILARKPGDENPFAESDLSDIFDGDGFSKRLWSPGESSHRFLCSHFDWLKNLKILQSPWLRAPDSKYS